MAYYSHPIEETNRFSNIIARAGWENNKIYPFIHKEIMPAEFADICSREFPLYFRQWSVVPYYFLTESISRFYAEGKKVRFATILRNTIHTSGAPTYFGNKQETAAIIQKVAEKFGQLLVTSGLYIEPYQGKIDWERGSFGNPHSCFWSDREGAKVMLESAFEADIAGAFRIYSTGGNGPAHPQNKELRGYGRVWAACYEDGLALFNAYPAHDNLDEYSEALREKLGYAYNYLAPMVNVGPRPGMESTLYINRNVTRFLAERSRAHLHVELALEDMDCCHACLENYQRRMIDYREGRREAEPTHPQFKRATELIWCSRNTEYYCSRHHSDCNCNEDDDDTVGYYD